MAQLVDLPAELLCRIASHLFFVRPPKYRYPRHQYDDKFEDDGFCNFRLSCHYLEIKTRHLFERVAFATQFVTLRAHSLSRLEVISNHGFGKWINKLVFAKANHPTYDQDPQCGMPPHQYAGYGVIEIPKHHTDGIYPNNSLTLRKRVQLGLQGSLDTIMARTPHLRSVVIESGFMASFWLDSPARQVQLAEQFQRNRETLTSDSDSDILDRDDSDNEDYDNDHADDPYKIETYVYSDYLLHLIVRAAQRHGVQLLSLVSGDPLSPAIRARTFVEVASALQGLKDLSICFSASNPTKLRRMDGTALYDLGQDRHVAKSLGHALHSLRMLRSLKFVFDDIYWESDRHINVSNSLRGLNDHCFEQLTSFHIQCASFQGQDLLGFFKQQKLTLRRLVLFGIMLPTIEEWRPILTLMLEEMLLLEEARFGKLCGGPQFFHVSEHYTESCCTIIAAGRQDLLKDLEVALDMFPNQDLMFRA